VRSCSAQIKRFVSDQAEIFSERVGPASDNASLSFRAYSHIAQSVKNFRPQQLTPSIERFHSPVPATEAPMPLMRNFFRPRRFRKRNLQRCHELSLKPENGPIQADKERRQTDSDSFFAAHFIVPNSYIVDRTSRLNPQNVNVLRIQFSAKI
jgi:hypothetical protein